MWSRLDAMRARGAGFRSPTGLTIAPSRIRLVTAANAGRTVQASKNGPYPKRVKPILLRALDIGFGIFSNIPGAN